MSFFVAQGAIKSMKENRSLPTMESIWDFCLELGLGIEPKTHHLIHIYMIFQLANEWRLSPNSCKSTFM